MKESLQGKSNLQHVIIREANFLRKSYAALHAFKSGFYRASFGSFCTHPLTLNTLSFLSLNFINNIGTQSVQELFFW